MLATVRALMERLIDYAGMFPPARLPMAEALGHYTQLSASPDEWMLGGFVCPASQLRELLELVRGARAPSLLRVAALGRGGRDVPELRSNLAADRDDMSRFARESGGQADVLEVPVPPDLAPDALAHLVADLLPQAGVRTFLEVPLGPAWLTQVQALCKCLGKAPAHRVGLKIRCGGATIPSAEQVAFFIACCRDNRVAWKATAGLHHALPQRDAASEAMAHGFLNVFLAGIFAHVHPLSESQLTDLLQERSTEAFRLWDRRIVWHAWACSLDQLREAREWVPSFGSCSFEEPRDALQALGLID
jgi:hypothetical protein